MQATLSIAAIYTKQPTREWEDRYLTWGCANVLLRLYESERGSERSNVLLLNMYESLWEYEVLWELLREVLWFKLLKVWELCDVVKIFFDTSESCVRCESFLLLVKYSLNTYPKQTKHGHDQVTTNMTKWQTWPRRIRL